MNAFQRADNLTYRDGSPASRVKKLYGAEGSLHIAKSKSQQTANPNSSFVSSTGEQVQLSLIEFKNQSPPFPQEMTTVT